MESFVHLVTYPCSVLDLCLHPLTLYWIFPFVVVYLACLCESFFARESQTRVGHGKNPMVGRVWPQIVQNLGWVGPWAGYRTLPIGATLRPFRMSQMVSFCLQKFTLHQKSSKTASGFYLGPLNKIEMQYYVVYGVRSRWIATIRSRAHQFEELTWGDDWSWWQPGEMIPKSLCVSTIWLSLTQNQTGYLSCAY